MNASEHDSVIFVGSGTTGAIHKLIHGLSLDRPPVSNDDDDDDDDDDHHHHTNNNNYHHHQ